MKKTITLENLVNDPGCLSEYDPNAMTIDIARKYIHKFLEINLKTEYVKTEDALNRILSETIISKLLRKLASLALRTVRFIDVSNLHRELPI